MAGRTQNQDETTASRIEAVLGGHPEGMHRLGEPAAVLDADLPGSLVEVFQCFDGGELFHETVILLPSKALERLKDGPGPGVFWQVGEVSGDDVAVDGRGRVFRLEKDTGEWLEEGTRFDRWLLGLVEAEALLYDADGEFLDDAFDEDTGEVAAPLRERMERRILKRDRRAPAPRWRLARALVGQGKRAEARAELEDVVSQVPGFAWAWFDLAAISESLGELDAALDELAAGAEARPGYEHAGYFWAQAARVAALMGDEARRAEHAARALAADPALVRAQRDGARATLEAGEPEAALRLIETALALAPRDLAALDLAARIREAAAQSDEDMDDEDMGDEDMGDALDDAEALGDTLDADLGDTLEDVELEQTRDDNRLAEALDDTVDNALEDTVDDTLDSPDSPVDDPSE